MGVERLLITFAPEAETASAALLREALVSSRNFVKAGGGDHEAAHFVAEQAESGLAKMSRFLNIDKSSPVIKNEVSVNPQSLSLSTPFKVLTEDGASPGAPGVKWSLPVFQDGRWKPGAWLHVEDTPVNAYLAGNTRRALHVSDVPGEWTLGQSRLRVFAVELEQRGKARWQFLASGGKLKPDTDSLAVTLRDFPASNMRLLRELYGEELKAAVLKR